MTKSKTKAFIISFLLAAVAFCLAFGLTACKSDDKDKDSGKYNVGEEGVYYYDKDASTEYLMSLQSGSYMISADGTKGYSGTYSYTEEEKTINFVSSDGEGFDATFTDDAMQLSISGTPYTFLKKVDYTVRFMDGSSNVSTQSVTYGRSASKADGEKDGYIFLGWYEDSSFTTQYKFDTAVTGDLTLYAYYIPVDSTIANFEVRFVSGGEVIYTTSTQNGVVYDFPETDVDGWWVSATGSADELTYKYTDQVLNEATNLYAVKNPALGASVYANEVTWEANVSSVTIAVDGDVIASGVTGSSYSYDFESLTAGRHEITVSSGTTSETLVYVSRALARVSNFSVYGTTLVYNAVENAQYYYISVTCANPSHDHSMVYNGNTLTYDFSNCEMGPEGITFTVYAYGTGYVESVSETFVYALILDGTEVSIDASTDTALWTAVSGATGYEVYINGEYTTTTTDTGYSLKYYDIGDEIKVSVKPVAPGYYSEASEAVSYTKATLPAPEITGINEYTVSWTEIDGATNYIIYVNGKQIETVSADITEYAYALDGDDDFVKADSYVITIKATNSENTNQNSQESDPVYATDDTMSPLLVYEDGTVYWQYAMAVGTYYVSINDENETAVEGKNSFDVTFTQSGENIIKVYFNGSAEASLSVTAYAVIFDTRGGNNIDTIYVAKGDIVPLATPEYVEGEATFAGWYTLPDLVSDYDSDSYLGDGNLWQENTEFEGNGTLILYAAWLSVKYTALLNTDGGILLDEDGNEISSALIAKNSTTFSLPVPVSSDAAYEFYGWYGGKNGSGLRYTDAEGKAVRAYNMTGEATLYACWKKVVDFSLTTYAGEQVLSVYAASDISLFSSVTVPAYYTYGGKEYRVAVVSSTAFNNCKSLSVINLPDTVEFVSTANNGYESGTGAFAGCLSLEEINVYKTDEAFERQYFSYDGVLYSKTESEGSEGLQLILYPKGKKNSSFVIPECICMDEDECFPVVSLATQVLMSNATIESVTFPATIATVSSQAFRSCSALRTVMFLDGVSSSEVNAASGLSLGSEAFMSCQNLSEVTLPARMSAFETSAFDSCISLEEIEISSANTTYKSINGLVCESTGGNTYSKIVCCPMGRKSADIDSSIIEIGEDAFVGCVRLTSVEIPASVTKIDKNAFSGCTGLASLSFLGNENSNELSIFERAFYGCVSLTSVVLPVNLTYLGKNAFGYCTKLTYVSFDSCSDYADQINFESGAFGENSAVETLELGAGVPDIDFVAIFGGNKLAEVKIDSANGNYYEEDGVVYSADGTALRYFPMLKAGEYVILDGCLEIGDYAFQNRTALTKITVPVSVTKIGQYAFSGCSKLSEIVFANGSTVSEICNYAFQNCVSLTSVTIPESVATIGAYTATSTGNAACNVFSGCSSLKEILVDEDSAAFMSVDGILYVKNQDDGTAKQLVVAPVNCKTGEVVIPNTVTKIAGSAFAGSTGVRKISFDGEVNSLTVGSNAFANAVSLSEVELPEGLKTISSSMFIDCTSLVTIVIPYTVTTINQKAFYGCTSLQNVIFEETPSDVTEGNLVFSSDDYSSDYNDWWDSNNIYYYETRTFQGCTSLKEIILPDRVTQLGGYMFGGCTKLETVTLGTGFTYIPPYMFYDEDNGRACTSLKTVIFSGTGEKKLTTICDDAFMNAGKNLTVELPSSVTKVGSSAFYACDLVSVTLNEGLKTIGSYAFYKTKLKEITIPSSVTSIGTYAFDACSNLAVVEFEGSSFTSVPNYAFRNNTSLKKVSIPSSVKTIGTSSFRGCTALTEVTFETDGDGEASLTSIGNTAFKDCKSLTGFSFPENSSGTAITLGTQVFDGCTGMRYLYVSSCVSDLGLLLTGLGLTEIEVAEESEHFSLDEENHILYGGDSTTFLYLYGEVRGSYTVPSTITDIPDYAFANQVTLTEVRIPVSCEAVGKYAFDGCTALGKVEFYSGETVTASAQMEIGAGAFRGCRSLLEIDLSSNVSTIGIAAFAGCESLKSVKLNSGMTIAAGSGVSDAYSYGAFAYCTSLETVELNGLRSIPAYTFYGCTSLSTVGDTQATAGVADFSAVTALGSYSFAYCGIRSVVLPAVDFGSVTNVFYRNEELSNIEFGSSGSTTLGLAMFAECSSLTDLSIPSGVTMKSGTGSGEAAVGAFAGCTGLVNVSIEGSSSLGGYLFRGCTSLETVTIGGATSLGNYLFYNCSSLSTIAPSAAEASSGMGVINLGNVTQLGTATFYGCSSITRIDFLSNGYIISLPDGVFAGTGITEAVLPSTVTELVSGSVGVFSGCSLLERVVLGGVTSLPAYTFKNCSSLTTVAPSSASCIEGVVNLTGINISGGSVFYRCESIVTVIWSGTTLNTDTFYGCTSLATLVGSATDYNQGNYSVGTVDLTSTTSINTEVFTYCSSVKKVVLSSNSVSLTAPAGGTSDPHGTFGYCTSLETFIYGGLTSLPLYMFYGSSSIKTVAKTEEDASNWPEVANLEDISSVGEYAFYGCASIERVLLAPSLTAIPNYAFYGCTSLESIDLSNVTKVNNYTFAGCESLKTIGTVTGVADLSAMESISIFAFAGSGLVSVILPTTTVGADAFMYCTELESVDFSGAVTLTKGLFAYCYSLESITLDSSIKITAGSGAATNTSSALQNLGVFHMSGLRYVDMGNMTSVPNYTFYGCESLTDIKMEDVTSIGNYSFYGTSSLESIDLPSVLFTVGNYSFDGSGLGSVSIPASVSSVGNMAFGDCLALTGITVDEDNNVYYATDGILYSYAGYLVCCPAGYEGTVDVPEGIDLTSYAFYSCAYVTYVNLPEGITEIPDYTFYYATGLKTVSLPQSLKYIGTRAFNYSGIESITIPSGVDTIDSRAFSDCESLGELVFEEGIETIGNYAFYNCPALREVSLPSSLSSLGNYTFYGSGLESLYIPGTVASLGTYLLSYSEDLKSVEIGEGIGILPDYMFTGCVSLQSVKLPSSLNEIGASVFEGCVSLTDLVIPQNVASFGSGALAGFTGEQRVYVEKDYFDAVRGWMTYSVDADKQGEVSFDWKTDCEAEICFYMERPDSTGDLYDYGIVYWYYDATGNIVEWTVGV